MSKHGYLEVFQRVPSISRYRDSIVFSKTLRVIVQFWRSEGHRIIMFFDDGIGGSSSFDLAIISSIFVKQTLVYPGFLLADEKCHWNLL